MSLKWKKEKEDVFRAFCGEFTITVDYDNDAAWTYTIEYSCYTVREFGDYIRSFGTVEKAKVAAELWLGKQIKAMQRNLGAKP